MNVLETIYLLGLRLNERRRVSQAKRLPLPVVSVGNITTGGTGKTPFVIALAREAVARELRPIVLTRGYRGTATEPAVVSDGTTIFLDAKDAGDEPVLIARSSPGTIVIKDSNRYRGGLFAIASQIDSAKWDRSFFILDDGFQHRQCLRDIDIVLIDGSDPFGNRRLLPSGILREPIDALKRAQFLCVTKRENIPLVDELKSVKPRESVFFIPMTTDGFYRNCSSTTENIPIGTPIFAFCGIARPDSFRSVLTDLGHSIVGLKEYRDHHRYSQSDIADIEQAAGATGAHFIVTTEKDIVKLVNLRLPENIFAMKMRFDLPHSITDAIFDKIGLG